MFTYREFADGSHNYRKQQPSSGVVSEVDYESARSENELAVLELSRVSDPAELASLYTHLDSLMRKVHDQPVLSFADCERISTIFTYSKSIAHRTEIAALRLDNVYPVVDVDYTFSTGGLIYVLETDPESPYRYDLPYVRVKVPITASVGKRRTITHETFIAMAALNPLRRLIPSFSFVFSHWQCASHVNTNRTPLNGLCDTAGERPVMVYENNPHSQPLTDIMRSSTSRRVTLDTVLAILLQIVGALDMAHRYADYCHYDLHSGNVIIQSLSEDIDISYSDFQISTRERVIIIDNGMAYCVYERPDTLAPLRSPGKTRFPNTGAIELFPAMDGREAAEARLQSTRIEHYGSIQNRSIGVHWNRSFPLGDVFRIFFDIYSLCRPKLRAQLRPLVAHFFSDADVGSRLMEELASSGQGVAGSSMLNSFSIPPFRQSLYGYRYADFAEVIMGHYEAAIPQLKKRRIPALVVGGLRLRDIMRDWRVVDPNFIPDIYAFGITALLDPRIAHELLPLRGHLEPLRVILDRIGRFEDEDEPTPRVGGEFYFFKISEPLVPRDLMGRFYREYISNISLCVNTVQQIRILYSNTRVIYHALDFLNVAADPIDLLAVSLRLRAEDLTSLRNFCAAHPLSAVMENQYRVMSELTTKVEQILARMVIPRVITADNNEINWYRACLPGVRSYLQFGLHWSSQTSAPHFGGELALPDLLQ